MSGRKIKIRFFREIELANGLKTYSDGSERLVDPDVASALVVARAAVIVREEEGGSPGHIG